MKKRTKTSVLGVMSLCLSVAVLFSSSTLVLAASGTKSMAAEIVVSGYNGSEKSSVTLNGEPVSSGRTFYSFGSVSTSDSASATINLGKLGRVTMLPGTKLDVSFTENSISGDLSAGHIEVFNNAGVAVNIHTPDNVVTNDSTQANSMSVDVTSGSTVTDQDAGIFQSLSDLVSSLFEVVGSIFKTFFDLIYNVFAMIINLFSGAINMVLEFFKGLVELTGGVVGFVFGNILIIGVLAVAFFGFLQYQRNQGRTVKVGDKKLN